MVEEAETGSTPASGEVWLSVRYSGPAGSRFDREFYVDHHVPMVLKAWSRYGLLDAAPLFPADAEGGLLAVCECRFRDRASIDAAFVSPEAVAIMAHVAHFTDIAPERFLLLRL